MTKQHYFVGVFLKKKLISGSEIICTLKRLCQMDSIDLKMSYAPNSHITMIRSSFAWAISLSYLTVIIPRSPCKYFFRSRSQSLCGKQGDECPAVSQTELDAYV